MTNFVGETPALGLRAFSERERTVLFSVCAVLATIGFGVLVFVLEVASLAILVTWVVVGVTLYRPRLGMLLVFGLVTLFEAGGADPLMVLGDYFHGGLASRAGIPGLIVSPLELLLILTLFSVIVHQIVSREGLMGGGALATPILLMLVALLAGIARGMASGGDVNVALWESRYLFYVVLCYLVAVNTIRTEAHVRVLTGVFLIGTALYAAEGAYRRLALIDTGQIGVIREFAYSHEVVIFLAAAIILVLAQRIYGAPRWQRIIGLVTLPVIGYTLLATERRAGILALIAGFVALAFVLAVTKRRAFLLVAVPLGLSFLLYLPLFWNSGGITGQPARAVRSLFEPDYRDASSNTYRQLESLNVRVTIQKDPALGVGFGREFLFVAPVADLSWWPFWRYEPHNQVMWVWLKTGAYGFVLFWVLMGTALAIAANRIRTLRRPVNRMFALLAMCVIVMTLVFCWVDLGLVSGRVTVLLGTVLGVLSVLDRIDAGVSVAAT
jgi:O-antigen ligase